MKVTKMNPFDQSPLYKHQWWQDTSTEPLPSLGKIVCVGRNYADHAKEMNSPVPTTPILFMKPSTAAVSLSEGIQLPSADLGECHYETEISILIGSPLKNASIFDVQQAIIGVGIALDLTLRDLQKELKSQGHPWERAKAFDGSCPLSPFIPRKDIEALDEIPFSLTIDGNIKQQGHSKDMVFGIEWLIAFMSQEFTLLPGDVVLTGTPSGVGALEKGQNLEFNLDNNQLFLCSSVQ